MFDSVLDQFGNGMHAERLHDPVAVKLDCPRGDVKQFGHLLGAPSFRHQLQDLAPPGGERRARVGRARAR